MRFWVGIVIPNKTYKKLFKLEKEISKKYKTYYSLNSKLGLHITITYQGNVDEKDLKEIEAIVKKISRNVRPFKINIMDVDVKKFNKNNVIYARVLKTRYLENLKKMFSCGLKRFGIIRDTRSFTPHITLACKDITKENFRRAFRELRHRKISLEFKATKFYTGKAGPKERMRASKKFRLKV